MVCLTRAQPWHAYAGALKIRRGVQEEAKTSQGHEVLAGLPWQTGTQVDTQKTASGDLSGLCIFHVSLVLFSAPC